MPGAIGRASGVTLMRYRRGVPEVAPIMAFSMAMRSTPGEEVAAPAVAQTELPEAWIREALLSSANVPNGLGMLQPETGCRPDKRRRGGGNWVRRRECRVGCGFWRPER